MGNLTHMNEQGRAKMVDVTAKPETSRTARAKSSVLVSKEVYEQITNFKIKKGDVLAVAQVAGIMGAKKTADVIPMCHPLPLTGVDISFSWQKREDGYRLDIETTAKTKGQTGVEMEALTAASVCALTVYDMCKALDKGMVIGPTYLIEKTGGKSGHFIRQEE
ncbi:MULTISPECIES: cyclic pyranopterin monophosphate synthase MoaC [Heyndrickxia]|uniref:Cyclic pyranopterin monophosphate synthase n=2 Tax=Heyndrickxia coagulans TaxID=1398 RepID=G2TPC4_HEYCO|nr:MULTISPECIES: cyclic pyranopterin monophosphate synthase MoaC [Heyndrickxia]AEP01653.1 molybdenum cofactor biosynthesis protein C [Heyndrickxia coagulans 36D1]APB36743.1 molybdenum cofactor biosynthesis protein C [Heyndrickxia coagulans]AWP37618.1 cyclic pyranopterin monophosphate synthase MoaC [Heyndrickxia coagulans]KGT39235.1 molybdenum cofactor biosynthesis protein C [Heyndrickxia coagulans P38]KWZ77002.1 molybdenum cofactor biosynthesis protein [Heyndrickxia coagulans]